MVTRWMDGTCSWAIYNQQDDRYHDWPYPPEFWMSPALPNTDVPARGESANPTNPKPQQPPAFPAMSIGQTIIEEIARQKMFRVSHPDPSENHVFVWNGNAEEQLSALVDQHFAQKLDEMRAALEWARDNLGKRTRPDPVDRALG